MAKNKDRISDGATVQIHRIHAISDLVGKVLSNLIQFGIMGWIAFLYAPVFEVMAGKNTTADFSLSLMANEHFVALLGLVFGAGGIVYGKRQSKLRRDVIERLHPYQLEHEKALDPERSSSLLSVRGDTAKEDL
jgi:hypothetical protein